MGRFWRRTFGRVVVLYSRYGWETQILETTFLAMFLVPLYSLSKIDRKSPPSILFVFLMRFLIARIMLGAGLIKVRGDQCWRDRKWSVVSERRLDQSF